jgi:hypothetical protein
VREEAQSLFGARALRHVLAYRHVAQEKRRPIDERGEWTVGKCGHVVHAEIGTERGAYERRGSREEAQSLFGARALRHVPVHKCMVQEKRGPIDERGEWTVGKCGYVAHAEIGTERGAYEGRGSRGFCVRDFLDL